MKINIFIFSSIFYISGIFINNFFGNILFSFIVLLLVELFFLIIYLKNKKFLNIQLFGTFAFILGIFISSFNLEKIEENLNFVNKFTGKTEIISEIEEVKEVKEGDIIYKGRIISIDNLKPKNDIYAETFVKNKGNRLKKGEIIKANSKVYVYKDSSGFSYKKFMISNGYYFKYYANGFTKIGENKVNFLEEKIIGLREEMLSIIRKIYPEKEAIFLGGILLGAREELPKELKQNFNNSGLTHFIAVSGFNITILIVFFSIFLKYLPKYFQIPVMSIIILLFVILVGPSAPVVRAGIMGFIGYLVLQNGRQNNILATSLLTLLIMISFNPLSINHDISLHLSFLAVFGIIYTEKFFNRIFKFLPNVFEIRTAISITFSALVFTLPVMMFGFGRVSTVSPITNLLVSWSIPLAMLFGFLSIVFYAFFAKLGIIIGFFAYLLLRWNIEIVNFFGSMDFLVLKSDFGEYKGYYQLIYLIIFTFIIIYFKKKD
ncbi:ComEC/Rec2 family competence protein [Candidatus Gracilibacteria bacterium]|nr:MAG: ComEC/Rec2 family competence protein [Candidatus Gracilibacteria bacterium]